MTIEEFNKIPFTGNMVTIHKGKEFSIISCDFEEKSVCIQVGKLLVWIGYKNLKLL